MEGFVPTCWDNNTDAVNNMWGRLYEGVFECNKAIDELLPFEGDENTKVVLSKLRTLRAFYYYLLLDNYGDIPLVTSFFDAPDKPFKEERKAVADYIIASLKKVPVYYL
ncbi:MAG: RagB/SusD family nutrient uptake outer membrane protein [Saprospiraceae bacterium]